jgi:DNA-binding CsgD family transcriptional regulator
MESLGDSSNPSNPDGIVGIRALTQGSNFQLDSYIPILRTVFERFGINKRYLSNPHEYSSIFRYERYVRLHRNESDRLTRTEGFIDNLEEYCRTHGDSGERKWDNGQIQGYYDKVKFDPKTAESLISGHSVGKQVKHYHPEHVRNNLSDPLAHPKLGIALLDDKVPWKDRHDLISELDELLINSLSWSGIETRAGDTYVADDHFDNTDTTLDIQRYDDPIPQIRDNQQQRINELTVNPDLTNSDREILQILSEGTDTIDTIAESIEHTQRTVYRAINRLDDILRLDNGTVKFESENLQTAISGLISEAKSRIESVSDSTSPFQQWKNRYGVDVSKKDGRMMLRFGEVPQEYHNKINEILDYARSAWIRSDNRESQLKFARATWKVTTRDDTQNYNKSPLFR